MTGTMLELWRPPRFAGEAVGCLATTYTFQPGLFDEQCLARFLEVDSAPDREDLAFLLERETRLGSVYAGVLIDHTQSGVEHSLRWDVLPVRIPNAKQHAKLSLLAWNNYLRIIVTSANLTEQGYRQNQEVCITLENTPENANINLIYEACDFLESLLAFVPGAGPDSSEVRRARVFLIQLREQVSSWKPTKKIKGYHQHLVFTLPSRDVNPATGGKGFDRKSSLSDAIKYCSRRGGAPDKVWIASPFFDVENNKDATTSALCKSMARNVRRKLRFCIPEIGNDEQNTIRLAAPASLLKTSLNCSAVTRFSVLPNKDTEGNIRPWHAKIMGLFKNAGNGYTGLMVGSSNFTHAGMGISKLCNTEANLLTIAEHLTRSRMPSQISEIWPQMIEIKDPTAVEWQGATNELVEEEQANKIPVPAGFLSATYHAGDQRFLVFRLDPDRLPKAWKIFVSGKNPIQLLTSEIWGTQKRPESVSLPWESVFPPEKLLVRWVVDDDQFYESFFPLNVEDAVQLPPPAEIGEMTADDMLCILAASDPGAAFRVWAKKKKREETFDDELDTAIVADLDPLKRYKLKSTFLRRVRSRARVLAQLRENLQRPVWNAQALQWRLEGFIGIRPLAERLLNEFAESDSAPDEALLTLADFVILLREVSYAPVDGSLTKEKFNEQYEPFLARLVEDLNGQIHNNSKRIGRELLTFWDRVVQQCHR